MGRSTGITSLILGSLGVTSLTVCAANTAPNVAMNITEVKTETNVRRSIHFID
jgi:hypothetical protein